MFSQFFGGQQSQQARKGPNLVMDMEIELEDVYSGKTYEVGRNMIYATCRRPTERFTSSCLFQIQIQRNQICEKCDGSGAKSKKDVVDCHVCSGRGIRIVKQMMYVARIFESVISPTDLLPCRP